MNKTFSLALNVVLTIAVGFLYYLHFSADPANTPSPGIEEKEQETVIPAKLDLPQQANTAAVLYVNADTLFEKYEYVKAIKKDAESKQANLESRYTQKSRKFQEDYMAYQQKVSTGNISQDDARATEEDLMKRKDELEEMELQLNKLVEETQKKNALVQADVAEFFKEYSKGKNLGYVLAYTENGGSVLFANDSLDATRELVDALNERYLAKKKK